MLRATLNLGARPGSGEIADIVGAAPTIFRIGITDELLCRIDRAFASISEQGTHLYDSLTVSLPPREADALFAWMFDASAEMKINGGPQGFSVRLDGSLFFWGSIKEGDPGLTLFSDLVTIDILRRSADPNTSFIFHPEVGHG